MSELSNRPTRAAWVAAGADIDPDLPAQWFRALYETSQLFSGILDEGGNVLDGNELAIEGCGLVRDDVIGTPFWRCGWWNRDPEVAAAVEGWFDQVVREGEALRTASRYFLADGTPRMVDLSLTPVADREGVVRYVVATGSDITDAVAAQAERHRRMEAELSALQELERRSEARLRRLSAVAMDLVHAETVHDLTEIVVNEGVAVLGADGGGVIVRGDDALLLALSNRFSEPTQDRFSRLPLDDPLPGPRTARTGERMVLPTVAAGLEAAPEMAEVYELTGRRAWVCEPLRVGDELLGSLIVSWVEEREFAEDELALIAAFAAQCAQALRRIQASEAERAAARQAARLSESLQSALLTEPPTPPDLRIAVRYLPAMEAAQIGGDWHDAFLTMDGATILSVGDVFGHDSSAAATMAQVRNLLRGLAIDRDVNPATLLTRLERALDRLDVQAFASAVVARVERLDDGRTLLCWSNAGHPPPVLRHPDGTVEVLGRRPDRILGLAPDDGRVEHRIEVDDGSTLVLYTDGLIERRGELIDVGLQRLADALAPLDGAGPSEVCDRLLAEVLPPQHEDDVAILVLQP